MASKRVNLSGLVGIVGPGECFLMLVAENMHVGRGKAHFSCAAAPDGGLTSPPEPSRHLFFFLLIDNTILHFPSSLIQYAKALSGVSP